MSGQAEGVFSPFLRRQRFKAALPWIKTGMILDFGCGAGHLANFIDPKRYLGVELNPETLRLARQTYPAHRFIATHSLASHSHSNFDVVVGLAVLEHLDNPAQWLAWAKELLRTEGAIVVTTPRPGFRFVHEIGARLGLFSSDAAEEHKAFLGPGRISELSRATELEIVASRRFLCRCNQLFVLKRRQLTP